MSIFFEEGCFIVEISNSSDDPEVSIARARVEPGRATQWHRLMGISERYVILEGKGPSFDGKGACDFDIQYAE